MFCVCVQSIGTEMLFLAILSSFFAQRIFSFAAYLTSKVMLRQDSAGNHLLQIELAVSMVTSTAAVGAMVAGIFEMNLDSGIQDSKHLFWGTAATLVIGMIVFCDVVLVVIWRKG